MKLISVVLPCLNESENLPLLIPEIIKSIPSKYSYEIICVDDGSTDETPLVISGLATKNKRVRGIVFYRRFGHQQALRAGIQATRGDAVITMDSDFQHPPHYIPKLIDEWEQGHDLVRAQKKEDNSTSLLWKVQRRIGYHAWAIISNGILIPGVSDFRLISRQVVNYINKADEHDIFLRGLVALAAKSPIAISYKVDRRKHGRSSYSLGNFINMFINGAVSFSARPLRIASIAGIAMTLGTITFIIYDLVYAFATGRRIIEGWVTTILVLLILNGFMIFYMGILGEYIGVIFKEVKRRPSFLIKRTINLRSK